MAGDDGEADEKAHRSDAPPDPEAARYLESLRRWYRVATDPGNPTRKLDAPIARAAVLESVAWALAQGCAVPDWLAHAFVECFQRFDSFEVHTLGEAFGVADRAHLAARRSEELCGAVAFEVDRFREEGLPLKDNASGPGALARAAAVFNMAPKTAELRVRQWRALESRRDESSAAALRYERARKVRLDHMISRGYLLPRAAIAATALDLCELVCRRLASREGARLLVAIGRGEAAASAWADHVNRVLTDSAHEVASSVGDSHGLTSAARRALLSAMVEAASLSRIVSPSGEPKATRAGPKKAPKK